MPRPLRMASQYIYQTIPKPKRKLKAPIYTPIPVFFGTKTEYIDSPEGEKDDKGNVKRVAIEVPNQVNNVKPAWTVSPASLSEEDYQSFYRELYPSTFDAPLFNIHLNVDYPFNLTGVLYFPKITNSIDAEKHKVQLYCNQVFVTDNVKDILPEFRKAIQISANKLIFVQQKNSKLHFGVISY